MTQFVKLTRRNGACVYVNPAHVLYVEPQPLYATPAGGARVERVGTGSKVVFALAGRVSTDGPSTDTEPYWEVVEDAPERVVADLERALLVVPV